MWLRVVCVALRTLRGHVLAPVCVCLCGGLTSRATGDGAAGDREVWWPPSALSWCTVSPLLRTRTRLVPAKHACAVVSACRFSTSIPDITSTEIRIRKLEYNLSKLLAHKAAVRADKEAKEKARRDKQAADAAEFARISSSNDGQLRIKAARDAKKPLPGDPRAAEFRDDDSEVRAAVCVCVCACAPSLHVLAPAPLVLAFRSMPLSSLVDARRCRV